MQEGFQNFNNANFDPNSLANLTSTAILFLVINDNSGSVSSYTAEMNKTTEELFMVELKNSHRKDDIMVKSIVFGSNVEHKSGFMKLTDAPNDYFQIDGSGGVTALYEAVKQGLEHVIQYREDLENQGIEVRVAVFICTDGADNASGNRVSNEVKTLIDSIKAREEWISTFTINVLGVGPASYFTSACKEMGLDPTKCLVTVNNSPGEIRKQLGVVSQSISSSSNTATINF